MKGTNLLAGKAKTRKGWYVKTTMKAKHARLQGQYLSGKALLQVGMIFRGYYWERVIPVVAIDRHYVVYDGSGVEIGRADTLPGCKLVALNDFKEYIEELVRGV